MNRTLHKLAHLLKINRKRALRFWHGHRQIECVWCPTCKWSYGCRVVREECLGL